MSRFVSYFSSCIILVILLSFAILIGTSEKTKRELIAVNSKDIYMPVERYIEDSTRKGYHLVTAIKSDRGNEIIYIFEKD